MVYGFLGLVRQAQRKLGDGEQVAARRVCVGYVSAKGGELQTLTRYELCRVKTREENGVCSVISSL